MTPSEVPALRTVELALSRVVVRHHRCSQTGERAACDRPRPKLEPNGAPTEHDRSSAKNGAGRVALADAATGRVQAAANSDDSCRPTDWPAHDGADDAGGNREPANSVALDGVDDLTAGGVPDVAEDVPAAEVAGVDGVAVDVDVVVGAAAFDGFDG